MYTSSWCAYALALAALFPLLADAVPVPAPRVISAPTLNHRNATKPRKGGAVLPFKRSSVAAPTLSSSKKNTKPKKGGVTLPFVKNSRRVVESRQEKAKDGEVVGGTVGIGNSADL